MDDEDPDDMVWFSSADPNRINRWSSAWTEDLKAYDYEILVDLPSVFMRRNPATGEIQTFIKKDMLIE